MYKKAFPSWFDIAGLALPVYGMMDSSGVGSTLYCEREAPKRRKKFISLPHHHHHQTHRIMVRLLGAGSSSSLVAGPVLPDGFVVK